MTNQSINSLLRKEFTNSLLDKLDKIAAWNVEELLLDRRFGDFNFQDCVEIFQRAKTWAIDLRKYGPNSDSGNFFSPETVSKFFREINEGAENIKIFQPTSQANPGQGRKQISEEIKRSYDSFCPEMERVMIFEKVAHQSKILDEELSKIDAAKDVSEIKKSLSGHQSELKKDLSSEHEKIRLEILSLKEAQATKGFSEYFSKHSESYNAPIKSAVAEAKLLRVINYLLPFFTLVVLLIFFLVKNGFDLKVKNDFDLKSLIPFFVLFSVLMSLVFYHLKSATRDLNIAKNAKESYEHRAKVAETFIAFLASESKDKIAKSEMAKQAAIAMFQRVPSGYLTKDQIEPINHPLAEILLKRG